MIGLLRTKAHKLTGLLVAILFLLLGIYASIIYGVINTGWKTAIDAFLHFNGSNEHIVIKDVRIPRALIAAAVGASLGIAGTLLQSLTRNPLADTGLMGLNAGAGLFIVIAVTFFSAGTLNEFAWVAFLGSACSGVVVFALGSAGREGMSPLRVTLAGAAVTALASSMTHAFLVINQKTMDEVLFWLAGSVAGRKLSLLTDMLPYMVIAWIAAFVLAGPINTLLLGEDVAKGLGQRTALVKLCTGIVIVLLTGASVAVAGPIGFIGLVVPHLARYLIGQDVRWVVVYSGLLGAILLLVADIGARFVAMPKEIPIGVMTAIIGTPFFVYVARKGLTKS